MTCLCEYMTPERALSAGLSPHYFDGKVCAECSRNRVRRVAAIVPIIYEKAVCVECGVHVVYGPRCKSCASKGHARVPHWQKSAPLKERYAAVQHAV